jgi:1-deoxy-D-xylulose-5-phosphate synthase
MDVALHSAAVTFVLDRAGATGDDGPSHNGMWDLSVLQVVPGLRIAAPRDGERLRQLLREAVGVSDGPTVVRFPKGAVGRPIPATGRFGTVDLLRGGPSADALIVGIGSTCADAIHAAQLLTTHGISATVADPRWIKPVSDDLVALAAQHRVVVTIEDNGRNGGAGSAVAQAMHDHGLFRPFRNLGISQRFQPQGSRAGLLAANGLGAEAIEDAVLDLLATDAPWAAPAGFAETGLPVPPTLHEVTT